MLLPIPVLLLLLLPSITRSSQQQIWKPNDQFDFDFYVFAQSWQAEFCRRSHEFPGCQHPDRFWQTHFTIHGLWPEVQKGRHPEMCTAEPFDPKVVDRIGRSKMIHFWPNVKFNPTSGEYDHFWRHEWQRHGTCSDLTQVAYFTHAIRLLQNLSSESLIVAEHTGETIPTASVRKAFGGKTRAVLKCDDAGVYLAQVFTCWHKDAQHRPTDQIDCPVHILAEDTCHRPTVSIIGK